MSNFTPDDWIKITTSSVCAWWFARFLYLVAVSIFGGEGHTINVNLTVTVEDDD